MARARHPAPRRPAALDLRLPPLSLLDGAHGGPPPRARCSGGGRRRILPVLERAGNAGALRRPRCASRAPRRCRRGHRPGSTPRCPRCWWCTRSPATPARQARTAGGRRSWGRAGRWTRRSVRHPVLQQPGLLLRQLGPARPGLAGPMCARLTPGTRRRALLVAAGRAGRRAAGARHRRLAGRDGGPVPRRARVRERCSGCSPSATSSRVERLGGGLEPRGPAGPPPRPRAGPRTSAGASSWRGSWRCSPTVPSRRSTRASTAPPAGTRAPWALPIQSYLEYQGKKLRRRFDARRLPARSSRRWTHHDLGAPGRRALPDGPLRGVRPLRGHRHRPALHPGPGATSLADWLTAHGAEARRATVRSPHGHDAFLIEWDALDPLRPPRPREHSMSAVAGLQVRRLLARRRADGSGGAPPRGGGPAARWRWW